MTGKTHKGATSSKTATTAWDPVEHFETEADMAAYLEAALEDGDPALVTAALGDIARFRVNIFKQKGTFAMVLRKLNTRIPTMEDLKLPPVFQRIIQEKTGLIFITGATGTGKSVSLQVMAERFSSIGVPVITARS